MIAKSIKGKSLEEIKIALQESMADGFKPTLAIVFLSSNLDINEITGIFSIQETTVFGATSVAGFIDENFDDGSSAILLLDLPTSYFKLYFMETPENSTKEIAIQLGKYGLESFSHPAYIVATSGLNIEVDWMIEELENIIGSSLYIFGGRAGNSFKNDKAFVFNNVSFSSDAIAVLVIDEEKMLISGLTSHGWKPLGKEHIITKSEGRTVYTIDHQPALDVFTRYLGINLNDDAKKDIEYNIDQLGPVQLIRQTGENVIRDVSYFNRNDHSVIFQSNISEGVEFRFSLPPDFDIIEVLPKKCVKLKNENNVQADALIMFSCSGR
jgi:hypothetical protein